MESLGIIKFSEKRQVKHGGPRLLAIKGAGKPEVAGGGDGQKPEHVPGPAQVQELA